MKKFVFLGVFLYLVSISVKAELEVYGVLDVAIGTVAHQYGQDPTYSQSVNAMTPTPAPHSLTGMFNGGVQNSRWGIKGTEEIADDQQVFFQLESGFSIQNGSLSNHAQALIDNSGNLSNNASGGSTNGQLFSRWAIVGISDAQLGLIQFGRNYTPIYDILSGGYDPVKFAVLFSPLGFSSKYGGGSGVSENVRQDNSIKYSQHWGEMNGQVMYKFGNQAGSHSSQSAYAFQLGYEHGPWGIQAAYQGYEDAVTASAPIVQGSSILSLKEANTKGFLLALKYAIRSNITLKSGYQRYVLSAPSDPFNGSTTYYGDVSTQSAYTNANAPGSTAIVYFGGDYQIDKNWNLALGYYVINEDAYSTYSAGNIDVISALLDYKFSQKVDVYIGALASYPGGKYATSNWTSISSFDSPTANNSIIATGLRYKF